MNTNPTRKIERDMVDAIRTRQDWKNGNTAVYMEHGGGNPHGLRAEIYLHGNHLADYWYQSDELDIDTRTLSQWPTSTTKSRLRALGANVTTRRGKTYLDDQEI